VSPRKGIFFSAGSSRPLWTVRGIWIIPLMKSALDGSKCRSTNPHTTILTIGSVHSRFHLEIFPRMHDFGTKIDPDTESTKFNQKHHSTMTLVSRTAPHQAQPHRNSKFHAPFQGAIRLIQSSDSAILVRHDPDIRFTQKHPFQKKRHFGHPPMSESDSCPKKKNCRHLLHIMKQYHIHGKMAIRASTSPSRPGSRQKIRRSR
jgi:hypothetical protein